MVTLSITVVILGLSTDRDWSPLPVSVIRRLGTQNSLAAAVNRFGNSTLGAFTSLNSGMDFSSIVIRLLMT